MQKLWTRLFALSRSFSCHFAFSICSQYLSVSLICTLKWMIMKKQFTIRRHDRFVVTFYDNFSVAIRSPYRNRAQGTAQSSHIVVPFIRHTMLSSKFHIFLFRNFIYFLVHALCALDGFIVSMCVSSCHFVCVNCVNICQFFSLIVSGRETVYARLLPIQTSVDELLLHESPRNGCRAAREEERERDRNKNCLCVHCVDGATNGRHGIPFAGYNFCVCAAAAMMTMTTQAKGFFFPFLPFFAQCNGNGMNMTNV